MLFEPGLPTGGWPWNLPDEVSDSEDCTQRFVGYLPTLQFLGI